MNPSLRSSRRSPARSLVHPVPGPLRDSTWSGPLPDMLRAKPGTSSRTFSRCCRGIWPLSPAVDAATPAPKRLGREKQALTGARIGWIRASLPPTLRCRFLRAEPAEEDGLVSARWKQAAKRTTDRGSLDEAGTRSRQGAEFRRAGIAEGARGCPTSRRPPARTEGEAQDRHPHRLRHLPPAGPPCPLSMVLQLDRRRPSGCRHVCLRRPGDQSGLSSPSRPSQLHLPDLARAWPRLPRHLLSAVLAQLLGRCPPPAPPLPG